MFLTTLNNVPPLYFIYSNSLINLTSEITTPFLNFGKPVYKPISGLYLLKGLLFNSLAVFIAYLAQTSLSNFLATSVPIF
jgi:hypothetical protein